MRERSKAIKHIRNTIKKNEKQRDEFFRRWEAAQQVSTQKQNSRKAAPKAGSVMSSKGTEWVVDGEAGWKETYGFGMHNGGKLGEMTCTDESHVLSPMGLDL